MKCIICQTILNKRNKKYCSNKCVGVGNRRVTLANCQQCEGVYEKRVERKNPFCGRKCANQSRKGKHPWNFGKEIGYSVWRGKKRPDVGGSNHWNWKGGITPINLALRESLEYRIWRKAVFERDNYTCVFCGNDKGGNLEADHIKPFAYFVDLRFEVSNGRTLCKSCHRGTDTYMGRAKRFKQKEVIL